MDITVSPKQLATELKRCINQGLVPYVRSSPGVGKSSVAQSIAAQGRLKLIDLRLSQCTPEDLQGYPNFKNNKATFTPFDIFPLEGDELPDMLDANGEPIMIKNPDFLPMTDPAADPNVPEHIPQKMNGWLLLLDELSSANKSVQAAAYKLVLDRMVGSFTLHPDVYTLACGNKDTDKAVTFKMSTALQSRLIHYELETNIKDWTEWALKKGIDYRIIAFLNFSPNKLMDFSPDHDDKTYPCPRTWEFLDRLINGKEVDEARSLPMVAGTVGSGAAVEFLTFCKVQQDIPDWNDILDPTKAQTLRVPTEASARYATLTMITAKIEEKDAGKVIEYVKRYAADMQIIFCRGLLSRFPDLDRSNQAFGDYAMDMITSVR